MPAPNRTANVLLLYTVLTVLAWGHPNATSDQQDHPFVPPGTLSALIAHEYTHLTHPEFPRHSVRVKESRFCDGITRAYTGYVDAGARHLFFYFFESRRDPRADDVVLWINGGPGASSVLGLFMGLGPCRVTSADATKRWPHSWTEHANMIFIDQPVDVGFSYADFGESVSTTPEAAKDIAAFVGIFFAHFAEFRGRPFHMTGESYAGRYLPVFAAEVYDQNRQLEEASLATVNLTSVMIGNGFIDYAPVFWSYYKTLCEDTGYLSTRSIAECVRMKQALPRCDNHFKAACVDIFDDIECRAAVAFCEGVFYLPFADGAFNIFDRTRRCPHGDLAACYPIRANITAFLSSAETQTLLGVDPPARGPFSLTNTALAQRFEDSADGYAFPAHLYLAHLLERDVRVLLYAGTDDWICNAASVERVARDLAWSGQGAYGAAVDRQWFVRGQVAGRTRTARGLTFATIDGAGHMVVYDQPVRAFELSRRWLASRDL